MFNCQVPWPENPHLFFERSGDWPGCSLLGVQEDSGFTHSFLCLLHCLWQTLTTPHRVKWFGTGFLLVFSNPAQRFHWHSIKKREKQQCLSASTQWSILTNTTSKGTLSTPACSVAPTASATNQLSPLTTNHQSFNDCIYSCLTFHFHLPSQAPEEDNSITSPLQLFPEPVGLHPNRRPLRRSSRRWWPPSPQRPLDPQWGTKGQGHKKTKRRKSKPLQVCTSQTVSFYGSKNCLTHVW